MGEQGRDPRRDPRAGDDLLRADLLMTVRQRRVFGSDDLVSVSMTNGVVAETQHWMSLSDWRRWAAGAEVIRVADDVLLARLLPGGLR